MATRAKIRASNKISSAAWRERNKDKKRAINQNWIKNNRDRHRSIQKRARDKMRMALNQKLRHQIGNQMRVAIKCSKHGLKWERRVGYTLADLMAHLERQFVNGMDWTRFRMGEIHIDHVRPVSMFLIEAEGDEAFRQCWGLANLQPLWIDDHQKKTALEAAVRAKTDRLRERAELTRKRREIRT